LRGHGIYATLIVENKPARFQLDSCADVNIIPRKCIPLAYLTPTSIKLRMWNGSTVRPAGEAYLQITNPTSKEVSWLQFVVVEEDCKPLLGVSATQMLKLLTVNFDNFVHAINSNNFVSQYACIFARDLEKLSGKVKLSTNCTVTPVALPSRRIPLALKSKFDKELQRLLRLDVDEPTEWVSQIVVVAKKSVNLQLCIDPRHLNEALQRERYPSPVLADVLPQLSEAKFSRKSVFWQLKLDDASSYLTTFATPFSRY